MLTSELSDNSELYQMSKDEGDTDGLAAIQAEVEKLARTVEDLEFRRMFNNPADPMNCFLAIPALRRTQGLQAHGGRRNRR